MVALILLENIKVMDLESWGNTESRSNCLQTRRIHHQVKYWRLNANTCIVAAILFSDHLYIGTHYRAYLIKIVITVSDYKNT